MRLGVGELGFAGFVTKLFRVRLSLKEGDSCKCIFKRGFPANQGRLIAEGDAGGFENVVGNQGCLHAKVIGRERGGV